MEREAKLKFKELVVKAKAGDVEAFGEIYNHYLNPIFRFIVGLGVNPDDAADITQDVFIKAWQKIDQYADQGHSFGAWLYVIARTTAIDWLKKKKPVLIGAEVHFWDTLPSSLPGPEQASEAGLTSGLIQTALAKLGHNDREVIVLYYMSELSHEEIAQILGISTEAVRQRKSRALKTLRDQVAFMLINKTNHDQ